MKISVRCQECFDQASEKDKTKTPPYIPEYPYWEYPYINITETGNFYEFTCENGHKNRFILNVELYELLFQQAVYCIQDGYYREAIGTFNTAMERFIEYSIEILFTSDIPGGIDFTDFWKIISKQSERQLGAYYLLWSKHFEEMPTILERTKVFDSRNYTEIRNSIIHGGELASKEQAVKFGQVTFEYIKKHQKLLSEGVKDYDTSKMQRSFRKNVLTHPTLKKEINAKEDLDPDYINPSSIFTPTFLNRDDIVDFDDCLLEEKQLDYSIIK